MMFAINQTPHIEKQIVEHVIASFISNIVLEASCKFVGPQNGLTLREHAKQGFQVVLNKIISLFIFLSTFVRRNYLFT
jgi:small basic protein